MDDFPAFSDELETNLEAVQEAKSDSKDRWFDPWMCAKGDPLKALVDSFSKGLDFHEKKTNPRSRSRRPDDAETHRLVVEVLVANLVNFVLDPPGDGVRLALPLRKAVRRNRYENPALSTRIIRNVIGMLHEFRAVELTLGIPGRITTTVSPTAWFANRVQDHNVTLADIGRAEGEEVIILKRKNKAEGDGWTFDQGDSRVEYEDTNETHTLRGEVQAFNRFLDQADISFVDDSEDPKVNTSDRRLRRYFTSFLGQPHSFDRTGRLFGGWWLILKKHRRANILVQGHAVAILDYASMFGRLAYAQIGLQAPGYDLYDLTGLLDGYDATGGKHRKGVKKVFNAMMFGGGMRNRLPQDARPLLPKDVKVVEIRKAILRRNAPLEGLFGTKVGYRLMFVESKILLNVLRRLMKQNIVALPLHDGLLVSREHVKAASEAMEAGAKEVTGFDFVVDIQNSFHGGADNL